MLIGNVKQWASCQNDVLRKGLHSMSMLKCLRE